MTSKSARKGAGPAQDRCKDRKPTKRPRISGGKTRNMPPTNSSASKPVQQPCDTDSASSSVEQTQIARPSVHSSSFSPVSQDSSSNARSLAANLQNLSASMSPKPITVKLISNKNGFAKPRVKAPYEMPPINGKCPFLTIPGELRNKIYSLVFKPAIVVEQGFQFWVTADDRKLLDAQEQAKRDALGNRAVDTSNKVKARRQIKNIQPGLNARTALPTFTRMKYPGDDLKPEWVVDDKGLTRPSSFGEDDVPQTVAVCYHNSNSKISLTKRNRQCTFPTGQKVNVALLLTCRQVYVEFGPIIYSTSQFAFGHLKNTRKTLVTGRDSTKSKRAHLASMDPMAVPFLEIGLWTWIKTLHLDIQGYGEPNMMIDRVWCASYYDKWQETCEGIVDNLQNLEHLSLFIQVPSMAPMRLSHEQNWASPFIEFGRSTSLKTATVGLSVVWYPELVEAFSEYMRRMVLGLGHANALEAIEAGEEKYPESVIEKTALEEHWKDMKGHNAVDPWEIVYV